MRFITALCAGVMMSSGSVARLAPARPVAMHTQDPPELRGIRQSEVARFDATMRADTLTLRKAIADELVYTHSNGLVETKADHLSGIGTRHTVYESLVPLEFHYRAYGEVVVGTGRVHSKGKLGDTPFDVTLRVSTAHVWRDGRWQLVVWQSTRQP